MHSLFRLLLIKNIGIVQIPVLLIVPFPDWLHFRIYTSNLEVRGIFVPRFYAHVLRLRIIKHCGFCEGWAKWTNFWFSFEKGSRLVQNWRLKRAIADLL
jgi:hypothetical protein